METTYIGVYMGKENGNYYNGVIWGLGFRARVYRVV